MVNGGIHSFAKVACLELKREIRINVVASGVVEDAAEKYEAYFPDHKPIPMWKVVNGYVKSVLAKGTGEIIRMYDLRMLFEVSVQKKSGLTGMKTKSVHGCYHSVKPGGSPLSSTSFKGYVSGSLFRAFFISRDRPICLAFSR